MPYTSRVRRLENDCTTVEVIKKKAVIYDSLHSVLNKMLYVHARLVRHKIEGEIELSN